MTKNIQEVLKQDLCAGCGTCIALCPAEALTLIEETKRGVLLPQIDEDKCTQCGVCLTVCPGFRVDFKQVSSIEYSGKHDFYVGNYLKCYSGYAADQNLRYNSSSGGLVTALSIFALEIGWVDGIIVTKMNPEKPLR